MCHLSGTFYFAQRGTSHVAATNTASTTVFQSKDEPEGTGKAKNKRWLLSGLISEGV
jgi:hypothetical protein